MTYISSRNGTSRRKTCLVASSVSWNRLPGSEFAEGVDIVDLLGGL